jgi:hypothetical protein
MTQISTLFAGDIDRKIEEVIKVDQVAEESIADEIKEYVVTDAINRHFLEVLERYQETPQKPHEGIAIWCSGFFGSGKSSFAKNLGLAVGNRNVLGRSVADRFLERTRDPKLAVVLRTINEKIPTHTVIFDVSTDRGIRSGNQMLSEIMYKLFLKSLGYSDDLDLSELEITLEKEGSLAGFKDAFKAETGREWDDRKRSVMFALSEASRTLHVTNPSTFPAVDSFAKVANNRNDISPGKLADRIVELMERHRPGQSLMFVVDEVGQFVARDVQKMLDLQAVVQQLGVKGRGKHWITVTSQERLDELVSGLDSSKIELARLMDRFPLQVHLEPSDISEVTSRRVLMKNAGAEKTLGEMFEANRGRLVQHTRLSADVTLPDLSRQSFIDLYPLLPYQIDLIIQIVSGLRTQGGASKHVGGANRTIIKLAQQLLIHPQTRVADEQAGTLVRLDQIYDLVEGNISSDIRAKIASIPSKVSHPLAPAVAKTVCLLQFVRTVHRSAENIAAALHARVDADSRLSEVREALAQLEKELFVRNKKDGYQIPTPAEDDWDQTRNSFDPKQADSNRIYAQVMDSFWSPAPMFNLGDTKQFKAGLMINGRSEISGDITFKIQFADDASSATALAEELRIRSQTDPTSLFWVITLNDAIRREAREAFRSTQMIEKKGRETGTVDAVSLIGEEKLRQRRHEDEVKRLLRAAALSGQIFFRGNDRSPDGSSVDVGKTASATLGVVLPLVYERFDEASAKAVDVRKGLDALFVADNLNGLPIVFDHLGLLRDEKGKPSFKTDTTPLSELLAQIEAKANYGDQATGKWLEDEFSKPPFGWDFDVVRLLTLSLLRAGAIEAVSKGVTIDSATSTQAKEAFNSKRSIDKRVLIEADDNFKSTFGSNFKELTQGAIASELRAEVERHEDAISSVISTLHMHRLPGAELLETATNEIKGIRRGSEENAITTFNASHRSIKEAIKRASDLTNALTQTALRDLDDAREVLRTELPVLQDESDLDQDVAAKGVSLRDNLAKETFFRDVAAIEQAARAIRAEYKRRYDAALDGRVGSYLNALQLLERTPGWERLSDTQQDEVSRHLRQCADRNFNNQTIRHLRSETEACGGRLATAIERVHHILEGERLATVDVQKFFSGGVDNEEQLETVLTGIREEFSKLLGAGKKVIVR